MTNKEERRYFASELQLREAGDESSPKIIEGYAALYNNETVIGDFTESIAVGAFDNVLGDDIRALFNHDANYPLARSVDGEGTLEVSVDERGLKFKFEVGEQQYAQDLYKSIMRGDVDQASFGFTIDEQEWERREDNSLHRTINKVAKLYDVSPVTYPAYADTSISARSMGAPEEVINTDTINLNTNQESDNGDADRLRLTVSLLKLKLK